MTNNKQIESFCLKYKIDLQNKKHINFNMSSYEQKNNKRIPFEDRWVDKIQMDYSKKYNMIPAEAWEELNVLLSYHHTLLPNLASKIIENRELRDNLLNWLEDNCKGYYSCSLADIKFQLEKDYLLFKVSWAEYF